MRTSIAIVSALFVAACAPPDDPEMVLEEDFETLCDGLPCGWVLSGGPASGARWIETIPGDHGLELEGEGVFVRGPASPPLPRPTLIDTIAVRANARCDATSSVTVRVTIEDGLEADATRFVTFETELLPEAAWSSPLMDQVLEPVEPGATNWTMRRVLGLNLLKNGRGSCEIDYIGIRAVNRPFI